MWTVRLHEFPGLCLPVIHMLARFSVRLPLRDKIHGAEAELALQFPSQLVVLCRQWAANASLERDTRMGCVVDETRWERVLLRTFFHFTRNSSVSWPSRPEILRRSTMRSTLCSSKTGADALERCMAGGKNRHSWVWHRPLNLQFMDDLGRPGER
jgi:hypothetical protein